MWAQMLDLIDNLRAGRLDLAKLVSDLRGLFVEADPHDPVVREDSSRCGHRSTASTN